MGDVDTRARNWCFLLYPESMKKDAFEQLASWCIPAAVSPLHDPDPDHMKPHYHVVLAFSGKKSYAQMKGLAEKIGGVVAPANLAKVEDLGGMIRYLVHKDNPDKQQFASHTEIRSFAGLNIEKFFELSTQELQQVVSDMMQFVKEHNILEFQELADACVAYNPEWFHALITRCTYVMNMYIKSRRHSTRRDRDVLLDPEGSSEGEQP